MIYDPIRDRLLMFGAGDFGDVWALTLSDPPTWQLLPSSGNHPSWRLESVAVYDSSQDRALIFGGRTSDIDGHPIYLNDTYVFSLATDQWTPLLTDGTPPAGRAAAAAIDDPRGGRMVLFGGEGQSVRLLNDLWTLSLGSHPAWTQLTPEGPLPTPRKDVAAVYDPVRGSMVIWSGLSTTGYVEDLWALSLSEPPAWTSVEASNAPERRDAGEAVYDPIGDQLIVYGGGNNLGWLDQCAAISLGDPRQWTNFLPPSPPVAPGQRQATALAFDSRRNRVVALGGYFRPSDLGAWIFSANDSATWTPFTPSYMTRLEFPGTAMYDSIGDQVLMYIRGSIWSLALGSEPVWHSLIDSSPGGFEPSIMLDPVRRRLILFGGWGYVVKGDSYTLSDIWALDLDGGIQWTHIGTGPTPQGSAGQQAFYDPVGDRMVVMGGYWMYGVGRRVAYGNAMWATPLGGPFQWTSFVTTGPQPAPGAVIYDSNRDRLLVFPNGNVRNVWSRTVRDTGEWVQLASTGTGPPVDASVVFDATRDQALALFAPAEGGESMQNFALSFGPPSVALDGAVGRFDGVEVRWRSASSRGRQATVERRDEQSDWSTIARITFDDAGMATARDRDVTSGARYAYRLALLDAAGAWFSDSTWVLIPPWPRFALVGARPNPTEGALSLVFSLPDAVPARLDVFDVSGRRVVTRDVGSLGPGTHAVAVATGRILRPGVYVIRLERAGQKLTTRAVVIR